MSQTALEVEHLGKKFRRGDQHGALRDLIPALSKRFVRRLVQPEQLGPQEFWALRDVAFRIGRGEAVGVIGHNGAGKSTLLKHLTGVLRPTLGQVIRHGRVSALIEIGAGFHQDLTGRENVFLNGVILGMSIVEIRRKFDEIVEFSGLADFIDTPVRRYSSGMFARLGFSVAAHLDPEILLVDEVLSVGDYLFQKKGVEKMKEVVANGATLIFVSHNLEAVQELCGRCLLFDHGRLLMDGRSDAVATAYLDHLRSSSQQQRGNEVAQLERFEFRGPRSDSNTMAAGDEFRIEIALRLLTDCPGADLILRFNNRAGVEVCEMSLTRLGAKLENLRAGDTITATVNGNAHMVSGAYEVTLALADVRSGLDVLTLRALTTLFVEAEKGVQGVANLYPRVAAFALKRMDGRSP